jgi:endonuclease/exonuclease/phosphatase family metal-dependent hydrolase
LIPQAGAAARVLTWNIHGAAGRNRRFDLDRVVALIRRWDPDVVALQEVDSRRQHSATADLFAFLQKALGSHGIGAKSITTEDGDYGQMLISRWPILTSDVRDISFPEREPRRAIFAEIKAPTGSLRLVATHLGLSIRERRSQTRALLEITGDADATTLVVGDFNDWFWPGSVRSALSRALPGHTRYRTFPSWLPVMRFDRIYCRPQQALIRSYVDRSARHISDHLPVIADVDAQARANDVAAVQRPAFPILAGDEVLAR